MSVGPGMDHAATINAKDPVESVLQEITLAVTAIKAGGSSNSEELF
jgi:hypothetical protein